MRPLRVTSVNYHPNGAGDESLRQAKNLIAKALPQKPHIIVLPECFANTIKTPEPVHGRIVEEMSAIASANNCYIVCPLYEESGGRIYNSSVLIDNKGDVLTVYHKTFPTDYEIAQGVTPGLRQESIQTEFGQIGLAICFDLNFSEVIEAYADSGAEIIFFSSAYEGGRQLAQWALDYSVYMVSAHWGGIGYIVDKTGHVLEKSNSWCQPVMTRTLNLDRYIFHLDYNVKYLDDVRREYGPAVHIEADVPEGRCAIESLVPEVDVLDIKAKYGLESFAEYMERSRKVREQALEDRAGIDKYLRHDSV